MRSFISLFVVCALIIPATVAAAGNHDWKKSISRLHPGDKLHLLLKTGAMDGTFLSASDEDLKTSSDTVKSENILKIERVREHGGSRGRHVLIGALIGGGAGAGVGAGAGGCGKGQICLVSRGEISGIAAAAGIAVGALVGALLPAHAKTETIYSMN